MRKNRNGYLSKDEHTQFNEVRGYNIAIRSNKIIPRTRMRDGGRLTRCLGILQETQGFRYIYLVFVLSFKYVCCLTRSSSPAVPEERYIKSATGGYIPGPPISRQGSSRKSARSDIPWYGSEGDDIDPRMLYRNRSRISTPRTVSKSLSPNSSSSSTLSSSMSSFIIDDPTSATSVTTLKTPTEVRNYRCSLFV